LGAGAKQRILKLISEEKAKSLDRFMSELMEKRGITQFPHNQFPFIDIPDGLSDDILRATSGYTDVHGKRFAIEASKVFHEISSHSDEEKEAMRGQIPYGIDSVYQILEAMVYPDIIEDVSHGDVLDQRNTFAVVKSTENSVIVVLSVGGKRNPNVTPQQIIIFSRQRWQALMEQGLTIREILYSNSGKRKGADPEMVEKIKKNRVTVAHRES